MVLLDRSTITLSTACGPIACGGSKLQKRVRGHLKANPGARAKIFRHRQMLPGASSRPRVFNSV